MKRAAAPLIVIAAILALPVWVTDPFTLRILIVIAMYATLGVAWNVLGGYAGQVSLGHSIFFGLGAYTSTLVFLRLEWSPWLGLIAGMVVAAAVAVLIGFPCFRLRGHYFAIATIGVLEAAREIIANVPFFGGGMGITLP
ncbi:MAG: branched-chain amino acid ABC transporter permease, partial [Candidatus Limnocylindria bacterium]